MLGIGCSELLAQGAPIGWNPYVVSARFVVHRVKGDKSLNDLADQIAQKIVDRAAELSSQDAARRSLTASALCLSATIEFLPYFTTTYAYHLL